MKPSAIPAKTSTATESDELVPSFNISRFECASQLVKSFVRDCFKMESMLELWEIVGNCFIVFYYGVHTRKQIINKWNKIQTHFCKFYNQP